MSSKGCIFEEVGSVNKPCLMCKRNPEDNRRDYYYSGGVDHLENVLGINLLAYMIKLNNDYDPWANGPS